MQVDSLFWKYGGILLTVFYGEVVYKLRRVKDTPNFISSGSKIVKRIRRRQYDPLITGRTIGLVLGPSTILYRPFLKQCTLTNKVVGTIWRALCKPPQRRQGPDHHPFWLLVGTPSAFGWVELSLLVFYVTCNDMWRHRCAGGQKKKLYLRSGS